MAAPRRGLASARATGCSSRSSATPPEDSLSARHGPLGGGEGRGEVGDSRASTETHLTLPALRAGPLLLPPKGGEGYRCSRSALARDGQAVAERQHAEADPGVSVNLAVEPLQGRGVGIVARRIGDPAEPQHIVEQDEPAAPQ